MHHDRVSGLRSGQGTLLVQTAVFNSAQRDIRTWPESLARPPSLNSGWRQAIHKRSTKVGCSVLLGSHFSSLCLIPKNLCKSPVEARPTCIAPPVQDAHWSPRLLQARSVGRVGSPAVCLLGLTAAVPRANPFTVDWPGSLELIVPSRGLQSNNSAIYLCIVRMMRSSACVSWHKPSRGGAVMFIALSHS